MANGVWLVYSNPKSPEREEEYHAWYNQFHIQQVLRVDGMAAVTRYKLSHVQMEWMPPMAANPVWPYGKDVYLAIYEVDGNADPASVFARLRETESRRQSRDPENEPVAWGQGFFYQPLTRRETSITFKPTPEMRSPDGRPHSIWLVPTTPLSPEIEDEYNRWYIMQGNLSRPGFAGVTRYKMAPVQGRIDPRAPEPQGEWPFGTHSNMAIWEWDDPVAAANARRGGQPVRPPSAQPAAPVSRPANPLEARGRYSWMGSWPALHRADEHLLYEPITYRVTPLWVERL
jgi:hypothetical protein